MLKKTLDLFFFFLSQHLVHYVKIEKCLQTILVVADFADKFDLSIF